MIELVGEKEIILMKDGKVKCRHAILGEWKKIDLTSWKPYQTSCLYAFKSKDNKKRLNGCLRKDLKSNIAAWLNSIESHKRWL